VPVRVVDFNDQQVLEAALVENIQRTDLNAIEKAHGFHDYLQRFRMTHEQLAARLGLDRSTVTNLVRLLDLPPEVQEAVASARSRSVMRRTLLAVPERTVRSPFAKRSSHAVIPSVRPEALVKEQKASATEPSQGGSTGRSAAPERRPTSRGSKTSFAEAGAAHGNQAEKQGQRSAYPVVRVQRRFRAPARGTPPVNRPTCR